MHRIAVALVRVAVGALDRETCVRNATGVDTGCQLSLPTHTSTHTLKARARAHTHDRCADCCNGCLNPVDHLEDVEEMRTETLDRASTQETAKFDSIFLRLQTNDPTLVSLRICKEGISRGMTDLLHSAVGETGLRCALTTLAVTNTTLTRLHLSQLSDTSACLLAAALRSVSAPFCSLELGCDHVSSLGMDKLGEAIHANKKLQTLHAWGMGVASTRSLARKLTQAQDLTSIAASAKNGFVVGTPIEQVEYFLHAVAKANSHVQDLCRHLHLTSLKLSDSLTTIMLGLAHARLAKGSADDTKSSALKLQVHWDLSGWLNHPGKQHLRCYANLMSRTSNVHLDGGVSFDFAFQETHLKNAAQFISAHTMPVLRNLSLDFDLVLDVPTNECRIQKALLKAVHLNTSLTSLTLRYPVYPEQVIPSLLAAGKIKSLSIVKNSRCSDDDSACQVENSDAVRLATALRQNSQFGLTSLALDHCITFEGARALSDALRINTSLTSLNLSTHAFDDESESDELTDDDDDFLWSRPSPRGNDTIQGVVDCLSFNTTLRRLKLGGLPIGKQSLPALCEGIKGNTTLEVLVLGHKTLDSPEIARFWGQLPEVMESML